MDIAGSGSTSCNDKNSTIQAINKDTVHRICSGQVVLNLAIAVKELVENSLDAGATIIEVRLKECGRELVEVIDNGYGVEEKDFEGLSLKHHTSKLQEFSDLVSIKTFGFRGEALSSLCSLSDLSVVTCHSSATCGTKLEFDNQGLIVTRKPCARQMGTTITLINLFYTLPVRQKEFHRNLRREFTKMTQLLSAYCLVSTGVKITCSNQNKNGARKIVVCSQGNNSVRENIANIFGAKQLQCLMNISQVVPNESTLQDFGLVSGGNSSDVFQLEGYISSCAHGKGRSTADRQFFYINSRPCELTKVTKMVNELYHQFNQHQYPFVFLNVMVASGNVDVNVSPDKRQIFLDHEKFLLATVKSSLLKLYEGIPSTFTYQNGTSEPVSIKSPRTCMSSQSGSSSPGIHSGRLSDMLKQWRHNSAVESAPSKRTTKATKRYLDIPGNGTPLKYPCMNNYFPKETELNSEPQTKELKIEAEESQSGLVEIEENSNITFDGCAEIYKHTTEVFIGNQYEFKEDNCITPEKLSTENFSNCNHKTEKSTNVFPEVISCEIVNDGRPVNKHEMITEINNDRKESKNIVVKLASACEITDQVATITQLDEETPSMNRKVHKMSVTLDSIKHRLEERRKSNSTTDSCNGSKQLVVKFHADIDPTNNTYAEKELQKEISKDMFEKMEIIGQFNLGFIITRLDSDLFIIDQHATDEKYNFEMLQKNTSLTNQKLVVPQTLELTTANESILIENENIFQKNGFDFIVNEEAKPTQRIQLTAIPMSKNWQFGKEDIDELLFMLQDAPIGTMYRPSRVRDMFASRACRKSVMIGTALSRSDMRRLVTHMGEIEQPWNCPHGRPTMRHLINLGLIHN